jgi:hypothetical protein
MFFAGDDPEEPEGGVCATEHKDAEMMIVITVISFMGGLPFLFEFE